MYLAWAAFYEGGTDALYFDVLIPRLLEEIARVDIKRAVQIPATPALYVGRSSREVASVAAEICKNQGDFQMLFIHADAGGRALEKGIAHRREAFVDAATSRCGWAKEQAVFLTPRHEMEAWAIADGYAVCAALGYKGKPEDLGLPLAAKAAETLPYPKETLAKAARTVTGRSYNRRAVNSLLPLIAQEQRISVLRGAPSFQDFESSLRACLTVLGHL